MKEKNDDEQSFDESEVEPVLDGMPETLSLLRNFRKKLKHDEIRKRELKKKVFETESTQTISANKNLSTQTMAQNLARISPIMLLKLVFIQMCLLALVSIFIWYLSAFINGRKNNDLSNIILKEKLNELKELEKQMKEYRNKNEYLLNENRILGEQIVSTKPTTSWTEIRSWATSLFPKSFPKSFSDMYSNLDAIIPEFENSLTKSKNQLFFIAVGMMNVFLAFFFASFIAGLLFGSTTIRHSSLSVKMLVYISLWCAFTVMISLLNPTVQISPLSSCVSVFLIIFTILILSPTFGIY